MSFLSTEFVAQLKSRIGRTAQPGLSMLQRTKARELTIPIDVFLGCRPFRPYRRGGDPLFGL